MEKDTRGLIKSEVERFTGSNSVVIVDSVNYIKGFRYELYCIAKNSRTTHCVVFVDTPLSLCEEFRTAAAAADPSGEFDRFSADALEQMAFRYEKPQSRNRWDKPLVVVQPVDAQDMDKVDWIKEQQRNRAEITGEFTLARAKWSASERAQASVDREEVAKDFAAPDESTTGHRLAQEMLKEQRKALGGDESELQDLLQLESCSSEICAPLAGDEEGQRHCSGGGYVFMPLEALRDIEQALFGSDAYKPNTATQPVRLESTNFVHELDRVTQQVISAIMDAQNTYAVGTEVTVVGCSRKFRIERKVSLAEFRRLRRQFLKITQLNPVSSERIGDAFVTYLIANQS